MIKKLILVLAAALVLPVAMNAQKFGLVNVNEVLTNLPEVKEMNEQLAKASKGYEDEFKKLQEELDKKYSEYQALPADTPDSIKERRMAELQELAQKMDQFRNTAQQDLQSQQQKFMAPIEQKIQEAVKAVGQEGSYTFIFQEEVALFHGNDVEDVTPKVKAKLNIQ